MVKDIGAASPQISSQTIMPVTEEKISNSKGEDETNPTVSDSYGTPSTAKNISPFLAIEPGAKLSKTPTYNISVRVKKTLDNLDIDHETKSREEIQQDFYAAANKIQSIIDEQHLNVNLLQKSDYNILFQEVKQELINKGYKPMSKIYSNAFADIIIDSIVRTMKDDKQLGLLLDINLPLVLPDSLETYLNDYFQIICEKYSIPEKEKNHVLQAMLNTAKKLYNEWQTTGQISKGVFVDALVSEFDENAQIKTLKDKDKFEIVFFLSERVQKLPKS